MYGVGFPVVLEDSALISETVCSDIALVRSREQLSFVRR